MSDSVAETPWRDRKRPLWLLALAMPLIPFAAVGLHRATGGSLWLWLGPIVILGVVPVLDWVVGCDTAGPPDERIASLQAERYYRWLTYLFLPLQYAGFVLGMGYIAHAGLPVLDGVALAVTVGFIGGLGINAGHELGHKKESHERWLSRIALAQTFYGHFYIEHNRGHHARVATPDDPASARMGESLYAFWPRTVLGSLRSAWQLEAQRLARRGQHPFRRGNEVVNAFVLAAVLWGSVVAWLGPGILPYLAIQALVGITLLEAVNYVEHYGLLRARVGAPGGERYERVGPRHSWNSNNVASNVLLYHLQRHSDHHAHPTRRYQALRDDAAAPALPTGYAGMLLLAFVPPLWRRFMDPLVVAHYGGDTTRAHVSRAVRPVQGGRRRAPDKAAPPCGGEDDAPVAAVAPRSAVLRCPSCDFRYDERLGDEREGFPAGTAWAAVPDDWCCPDCGICDKVDFIAVDAGR